jgi:hypothetical protein
MEGADIYDVFDLTDHQSITKFPYPGERNQVVPPAMASQTTTTTIDPLLLLKQLDNRWRNRTDLSYPTDRSIQMIWNPIQL